MLVTGSNGTRLAPDDNTSHWEGEQMSSYRSLRTYGAVVALWVVMSAPFASAQSAVKQSKPQTNQKESSLRSPANRDQRRLVTLADEVRHQLVMLPYYSVFDWLEAKVSTNGDVTLTGEV